MSCEDGKDGSILSDFIEVKRRLENGKGLGDGRGTQGSGTKFLRGLGKYLEISSISQVILLVMVKTFSSVHLERALTNKSAKIGGLSSAAAMSRTKCLTC